MDWRRRQGKATEKEIRLSLEALQKKWKSLWFMKLMDFKSYYQINRHLVAPRQPSDFIAVFKGKFYALEVKSSREKKRYPFIFVQKHQKQSLLDIERAGGEGWILLSWRRWMYEPRRRNRMFGFRIKDWKRLESSMAKSGLKSVDWGTVVQNGLKFKRKGGVWKLEKVFV